jgi:hypothetical protein
MPTILERQEIRKPSPFARRFRATHNHVELNYCTRRCDYFMHIRRGLSRIDLRDVSEIALHQWSYR